MSLFRNLFGSRPTHAPAVTGAEARRLVADGAVLVDVRTPAEFASGHADGAINLPLQDLAARRSELPRDVPVIVYCRSGGRSASAAVQLARDGFDVRDAGGLSNIMG